jgi:hypothetical protein
VAALSLMAYHGVRYSAMRADFWLVIHRIPHQVRHTILRPAFWIGLTLGFPLEHVLWERVWPFKIITMWLGL